MERAEVVTLRKTEDGIECPACDRPCKSIEGLKRHFTNQHEEQKRGNQFPWEAEGDVPCPTCGRLCADEAGMRRHHMWEHGESLAKTTRECRECGDVRELYESELEALEHDDLCVDCGRKRRIEHTEDAKRRIAANQPDKELTEAEKQRLQDGWREWWENGGSEEAQEWLDSGDKSTPPEAREKISKALEGHEVSAETRRKLSENWRLPHKEYEVEETGRTVRSSWEAKIDRLLHANVDDYEYEPRRYDLGDRFYLPDFEVGETVIEVKGYAFEHDRERAALFMQNNPEKTYVVVGGEEGAEVPCDIQIPWDERERLLDVL